jgi:hypothetical protein
MKLAALPLPKQVARYSFLAFAFIATSLHKATRTLLGTLVLLGLVYWYLHRFGMTKPLSPSQLALWIDSKSETFKAAVLSGILTIVGFSVALGTSMRSWKAARRTEHRYSAGEEINDFFQASHADLLELLLLADYLLDTRTNIDAKEPVVSERNGRTLMDRADRADECRQRLSKQMVSIHALKAKHENIVSNQPFGMLALEKAEKAFATIASVMWFPMPSHAPDYLSAFALVTRSDPSRWLAYSKSCEKNLALMIGSGAAFRSFAISDVLPPTWSSFNRIRKTSREYILGDE